MQSGSVQVGFLVNGVPVGCGGTFSEGDELTFEHNLDGGYMVDVEGAVFSTPNVPACNTRMYNAQGNLVLLFIPCSSQH